MPTPQTQGCSHAHDLRGSVQLRDVRFGWPGSHDVIDIHEFDVEYAERLFLVGPSGSGKSTLLSLLGGVCIPQRGTVTMLGTRLSSLNGWQRDRFRADHIGFVFQMFNLVPYLSMIDNVTLPCQFSRRRRDAARSSSGDIKHEAERLLDHLELGFAKTRRRPVTSLSIGQQQRVALARALIGSPEIIIADEPTSALDEGTRERFLELLFEECAKHATTLLLVSHDERLGSLFDRRIHLANINRAQLHDLE